MNQMLPRPRFWADAALQKKTRLSLVGEMMIFLLLYVITAFAQTILLAIPLSVWILGEQQETMMEALLSGNSPQSILVSLVEELPDWVIIASLFASAVVGVAALIYCRRFQKRSYASMGLRGTFLPEYLLGLGVGLALFLAVLGVGSAVGGYRLAQESPTERQILYALAALLGCAVHGASLELLIRGCFAPSLGARCSVTAALILSTLCSGVLFSGGSLLSMTGMNTLLLGLLLGIWTIKRGSLWGACALHAAWTFAGGYLFGFFSDGAREGIYLLAVDSDVYRTLVTGGEYGPQASICTTIVLLGAVGIALALKPKDPVPDVPEQADAPVL